jgi:UDP-N-acetylglucosamine diphosphorylase/glucosamine-1-phosphate N-acetyltransferase
MHLCIFEDSLYHNFFPLVSLRPVSDLRCGADTLQNKTIGLCKPDSVSLAVRDHIAACVEAEFPQYAVNALPAGPAICINARVVADEAFVKALRRRPQSARICTQGETIVAVVLEAGTMEAVPDLFAGGILNATAARRLPAETVACRVIEYPWDLVRLNSEEIVRDFTRKSARATKKIAGKIYPGAALVGRRNILIGAGSVVKPGAVLDAEDGPILIGRNVTIMPNAVIQGPASIGDGSVVKIGAKIYHGTSAGEHCKVGGEIEASILQSYSNKQHDGFLGHSYLGSWVNLGADTNTSDLKNTYGTVRVRVGGREVDTGEMFVGLTMGDHSKTGINVMFDTGTVVGVSCNIFGAGLPPKFVPSFQWGQRDAFVPYDVDKCVETARRVMARRSVTMSRPYEELLRALHASSSSSGKS